MTGSDKIAQRPLGAWALIFPRDTPPALFGRPANARAAKLVEGQASFALKEAPATFKNSGERVTDTMSFLKG